MFKNEFQGGNFIELFNPSLKDALNNCKVVGQAGIQKVFDKDVKGSVYVLEGLPTATKITIPKDTKQGLSIVQRCLVFQIFVKPNQELSFEIGLTDLNQNRRTLLFSTSHKELSVQPLSARIPIKNMNRSLWTSFVFDLASLISEIWKNQTFKAIDYFSICANCKLRKIFSMKSVPNMELNMYPENPFQSVDFPEGIENKLQHFVLFSELKDLTEIEDQELSNSIGNSKAKNNVFKIAFGTKVPANGATSSAHSSSNQSIIKSAKSHTQINHTNELNELLKTNSHENPQLSLSSGHIQTNSSAAISSFRVKSESDNQLTADNLKSHLSSPNQRKSSSSSKINSAKNSKTDALSATSSDKSSKSSTLNSDKSIDNQPSIRVNETVTLSENSNKPSNLTNNKIPHPPTRPKSSSTRKIRPPAVKQQNNQTKTPTPNNHHQQQQQQSSPSQQAKATGSMPKSYFMNASSNQNVANFVDEELSNEEDANNISSKTVFEYIVPLHPSANCKNRINDPLGSSHGAHLNLSNDNSSLSNMLNESASKTKLAQITKPKSNTNNNAEQNNLEDSSNSNSMFYSFSSRPKPVSLINTKDDHRVSANSATTSKATNKTFGLDDSQSSKEQNSSKIYDHRKYTSNKSNSNPSQKTNSAKLNNISIAKDSLNVGSEAIAAAFSQNKISNPNDLVDSFEALMLQEMKKDMESDNNAASVAKNSRNSKKNSEVSQTSKTKTNKLQKNNTESKVKTETEVEQKNYTKPIVTALKPANNNNNHLTVSPRNEPNYPKSPDVDYIETLQRGLQSPFSDDNNQEKYNFDVMTSSIEDTTTSISKRTTNRKVNKLDESNNYQDEMDFSLQSNLPAKSINLKDMPAKYSPLSNIQQVNSNKVRKAAITEEPSQYDDSQADIDEIDSGSDEDVELYYDQDLECYYNPKTGTYYELNMGSEK